MSSRGVKATSVPIGAVRLETDAGDVTIRSSDSAVRVTDAADLSGDWVQWPSSALAQLVTGYRSAETLGVIHDTALADEAIALLNVLVPPTWQFSRNEFWVFQAP